jgi:hypothetical protein
MNNINYYQKLKADYPTFGSTLHLDERQQRSLESLLGYTAGALNSYRNEVGKSRADIDHSSEFKAEKLKAIRTKCVGAIDTEFGYIQDRVKAAKTALYNATHPVKPADNTEELLRFMKSKEIRDSLAAMPLAKRVEFALNTGQNGDGSVLQAIEGQPVTSDLVPSDDMERINKVYEDRAAPQQSMLLDSAKMDLEGALAVKNLAEVEMGRIEA